MTCSSENRFFFFGLTLSQISGKNKHSKRSRIRNTNFKEAPPLQHDLRHIRSVDRSRHGVLLISNKKIESLRAITRDKYLDVNGKRFGISRMGS